MAVVPGGGRTWSSSAASRNGLMLHSILAKVFGTENERQLKRIRPLMAEIAAREEAVRALPDAQLQAQTADLRTRLDQGAPLDDLLVDAFAVVREAGWRTLEMRHFDVQLIGASRFTGA